MGVIWIVVLNWGFLAVSAGAIGIGIWLTRGRVRLLLAVALGVFLLQLVVGRTALADASEAAIIASSAVQGLLSLALTGTFVAAAVTGVREMRAKDAALAALTDETPDTWAQPEGSPDPRLLAD